MSRLKYRLRELLPRLSEQAKSCKDRTIKSRLYQIKAVVLSARTIKAACDFRGIGREKFYQWANRLLVQENVQALVPQSRRPKKNPNQTKREIEKKIIEVKKKWPFMGPERIANELEDNEGLIVSPSTIYAVLIRTKLISKEYRQRRTKKHTKRYRRPIPGYLQMDFKYVSYLIQGVQYYQLSAVDHCTSWRLIRAYRHKSEESVKEFLNELNLVCPFPIFQLQTDNDAAFTDKYSVGLGARPTGAHPVDEWCALYGCKHKLIPIGEKELNGKVENTHKYDDEEFFSQVPCSTFPQLQRETKKRNQYWNDYRKTKTLGWRTPALLVEEVKATILTLLLFCCKDEELVTPVKLSNRVHTLLNQKTQFPAKSKNTEDRILAWMAWEAAQYPKYAWFIVSGMSLGYSSSPIH
jgi:transposase